MNKLLILPLSMMFFISVFSYATVYGKLEIEAECDQAIIEEGVILQEAVKKAREALPEYEALNKARGTHQKARRALLEYESYNKARADRDKSTAAWNKARRALPESEALNKARVALPEYEALNNKTDMMALPESEAYNKASEAYYKAHEAYNKARVALKKAESKSEALKKAKGKREAYDKALVALPEYEALNKARGAYDKARVALPEYKTLMAFMEENAICRYKINKASSEKFSLIEILKAVFNSFF